jgi:septum formation protein
MTKRVLLLGSQSVSRQMLLKDANIPFIVVGQSADETACDWGMPLDQLVTTIAMAKMAHVVMPDGIEGDVAFVLTADTLSQDKKGVIEGKPVDKDDARRKLRAARDGSRLVTAFCIERKKYTSGAWCTDAQIVQSVSADYIFDVPEQWIERYLEHSLGLHASNAIAVEGYGAQFFRTMQGSYSTIVGLPMVEVREALEKLGFFTS